MCSINLWRVVCRLPQSDHSTRLLLPLRQRRCVIWRRNCPPFISLNQSQSCGVGRSQGYSDNKSFSKSGKDPQTKLQDSTWSKRCGGTVLNVQRPFNITSAPESCTQTLVFMPFTSTVSRPRLVVVVVVIVWQVETEGQSLQKCSFEADVWNRFFGGGRPTNPRGWWSRTNNKKKETSPSCFAFYYSKLFFGTLSVLFF